MDSPPRLLQDLAAAREDALWSAVRAVLEEADLARCLAQDACSGDMQLIRFLTELADRAQDQIGQLRKVIASISDLIEPDRIGAKPYFQYQIGGLGASVISSARIPAHR